MSRRQRRAAGVAAAGARVLPPHDERLEAGGPRAAARSAGDRAGNRRAAERDAMTPPPAERRTEKGLVERLLAPIADVRRGEAASALLMTLTMFLILAGYYMLKTAREVFILSEGGAEVKSYSSAGQALLLLVLVPAYGAFASRVNRVQLVQWVTLFFASNLVLFLVALRAGLHVGIVYFLWVGIFNLMVIAQFWAFANDLYTPEQGKRLFPLIGVGSSLGAWVGSVRAGNVVTRVGPTRLLIGGAVDPGRLRRCWRASSIASRGATHDRRSPSRRPRTLGGGQSGFAMILSDRYLMLIAHADRAAQRRQHVGRVPVRPLRRRDRERDCTAPGPSRGRARAVHRRDLQQPVQHVNLVGFLLQMFVVSRVFKFLGVGRSLFIHPIVALLGYLMMLRAPSFEAMRWLKVADNSIDYSLGNTTKQALWLPTSREAKYKAKQAVDSFFVRAGDVLQAGIVFIGERVALAVPGFAAVNVVLVGGWLAVAAGLNARLRTQEGQPGKSAGL